MNGLTEDERGEAIREVAVAHQFTSRSTSRDGYNTYRAGCTCDPSLEFDWRERAAQHREHLHAAIFDAARDAALAPIDALAEEWAKNGAQREAAGKPAWPNNVARALRAAIRDVRGGAS